jgi:hypothetical protein
VPNRAPEIDPNPYAPSAVAEPYDRREYEGDLPAEVGLWRDGRLVVMHVDARWPAICVKTGEPAVGSHIVKISRLDLASWWRREEIDIAVRLGPRWYWLVTRCRWILLGVGLLLLPATMSIVLVWRGFWFPLEAIIVALLGKFILIAIGGSLGDVVVLQKSRGSYLWLAGAREPFLAQLPPWPSG